MENVYHAYRKLYTVHLPAEQCEFSEAGDHDCLESSMKIRKGREVCLAAGTTEITGREADGRHVMSCRVVWNGWCLQR